MKILLILIGVIVGFFLLLFIAGMVIAAITGSKKNRKVFAMTLLDQLPTELIQKLREIFKAHKSGNVEKVNKITESISAVQIHEVMNLLSPKSRPAQFSSGKLGDALAWTALENGLQENGYSNNASRIVAGIINLDLDSVL
ncbi:MAG: hypothetical protein WC465_03140 [Patescibacteria group bacterium]